MKLTDQRLSDLLIRLKNGGAPVKEEIEDLLCLEDPAQIEALFEAARFVRARYFENQIFLYGFIYFSTHCRNNCRFCSFRKDNLRLVRYRKSAESIIETAVEMAQSGVHLIDLTMGEDPALFNNGASGFTPLINLVEQIRHQTGLPVMASPGLLPEKVLAQLGCKGATWYACYQETHSKSLFRNLRVNQDFYQRLEAKHHARKNGMLVEEGILLHVGERVADIADSILWMKAFRVDQARAMTFVPQEETPMWGKPFGGDLQELITIAVMRLVLGDVLIPASLDIRGLDGLKSRLKAGANVVTSIVPPEKGLSGVANPCLDIDLSRRSLEKILPAIDACGLTAATPLDYQTWVEKRLATVKKHLFDREETTC